MPPIRKPSDSRADTRLAHAGWVLAVVVVAASVVVPHLFDWDVHARGSGEEFPPLHGFWDPTAGVGTAPAVLLAVLAVARARRLAERMSWRWMLVLAYAASLAWLLALALVDGQEGLTRATGNEVEYLHTAREITDVNAFVDGFVDRIPADAEENWPIHVAGHPVGATLFFVGLVRVGLGGELQVSLVITAIAASIPLAVLVALRTLAAGQETWARRAAPFLVFSPAAVFLAVSADAVFTAVAAWGLAALAVGATTGSRSGAVAWSSVAGLLLGTCVLLSYGLPLLGVLALAVLWLARSWWPLPTAVVAALAVVVGAAAWGFTWWEAFPVLVERYWEGIASDRPATYWWWGNVGALLLAAGPVVGAGVAQAAGHWRRALPTAGDQARRVVVVLVLAALLTIALADASRMSKAEVERIWLPFMPWLTLSLALLPGRWQRPALAAQVGTALFVQLLLYTTW